MRAVLLYTPVRRVLLMMTGTFAWCRYSRAYCRWFRSVKDFSSRAVAECPPCVEVRYPPGVVSHSGGCTGRFRAGAQLQNPLDAASSRRRTKRVLFYLRGAVARVEGAEYKGSITFCRKS